MHAPVCKNRHNMQYIHVNYISPAFLDTARTRTAYVERSSGSLRWLCRFPLMCTESEVTLVIQGYMCYSQNQPDNKKAIPINVNWLFNVWRIWTPAIKSVPDLGSPGAHASFLDLVRSNFFAKSLWFVKSRRQELSLKPRERCSEQPAWPRKTGMLVLRMKTSRERRENQCFKFRPFLRWQQIAFASWLLDCQSCLQHRPLTFITPII